MEEAEAEVMSIADGLGRDVIEARARRVIAHANDIRARHTSVLDFDKRVRAIFRAGEWASVLDFLDDTGAGTFSASDYLERRSGRMPSWASRLASLLLSAPLAFRILLGTRPYAFYGPWGPVTEADQVPW